MEVSQSSEKRPINSLEYGLNLINHGSPPHEIVDICTEKPNDSNKQITVKVIESPNI